MFDLTQTVDRRGTGNMKGAFPVRGETSLIPLILAGAEMDFPTAPVIREALSAFALRGIYGFTLPDGDYLASVLWWLRSQRHMQVEEEDVVPTLGTIFALNTAIRAFTEPGDGVILMTPSYSRHDRSVLRNGRNILSCPLVWSEGRYAMDPEALSGLMAEKRNRLLVLCHPHNPTGRVWGQEELRSLAGLADKWGVRVFSDEIFADITHPLHPAAAMTDLLPDLAMSCTSLGKTFNFTGVNHAHVVIRDRDMREKYLQQRNTDHFGSLDPFFYQAVRAGYTPQGAEWVRAVRDQVMANHAMLQEEVRDRGYILAPWEGGFVGWMRAESMTGEELALRLERKESVLVDSGREYGEAGEGWIRFNLAAPSATIRAFARRLGAPEMGAGHAED